MAVDDVPQVREAAIEAVAHLRPFTAARLLGPLVRHPDLGTRMAALVALVPLDGSGAALDEVERLIASRETAAPAERARVARLLGRLGGRHAEALDLFLEDGAPEVRRAACEAAGDAGHPALVEPLLRLLVARETRREARRALVRYGDAVVDRLEGLLNDRASPADLRYRLPRILRGIGTARALEVILFSNTKDDPFLQYRLSAAAARIREAHPDVEFDRTRALEATLRRLDAYGKLVGVHRDLAPLLGPSELLVRALADRLDQHLDAAVRLAALVAPQRAVQNAWNRFRHGDARSRPYAVELLEHLVDDRTLARRLTGALERWHRLPVVEGRAVEDEAGADAATRLMELMSTRDVVLRAIAIATVRRMAAIRSAGPSVGSEPAESAGIAALATSARGPVWELLFEKPPVIPEEGPMSEQIVEKVLFLEGCDIFGESDVDDLTAVARQLKERPFRAGEVLFQENDPGDALFVIVEGRVKLEKGTRHLFDLGPRDSFGETSLLDNKPRPASATAVTDGVLFVLERADFLDLVSDRVELLRGIFGVVTRDLRSVLDAAAAGRLTAPGSGQTSPGRARPQTG
jgi:HEAT repeat protein